MIQRDYILRLTQQIAQLIAKLIGKSAEEKLEYIDQAFDEWLRMDGNELGKIQEEKLLDFLIQTKGFNVYQLELIAELLAKQGEALFEKEQFIDAKDRMKKSLIIFGHVDERSEILPKGGIKSPRDFWRREPRQRMGSYKLFSMQRMQTIGRVNRLFAKMLT